jgi:AcrR family transcriptional regulator
VSARERQTDTRARIQQVALDLFTEQGYEKTALREIAERLDVTKAALYYHFKTKEDIVVSIIEDGAAQIDELTEWASGQPRTQETRREIVRRYAALMGGRRQLMRFFQENQPAMRHLPTGDMMKVRIFRLLDLLTDTDAPLADQLRSRLALFSVHMSMFALQDKKDVRDEDLNAATLEVALELIDR